MGVAAAPGTAVTRPGNEKRETGGVSLWRRLVQVVRRSSGANATEAERILLEADFGVEATQQILAAVSGATEGDFRAAVERAVTDALVADALGDPAAVAFDAIAAARARGADTVLVDTAGRLHTEDRLLEELKKMVRVVAKLHPGAPHESLLVLDGTVGQNAVQQARAFAGAVPLSGLVVTKLDGTAKGGSVVALKRAVRVPVRFLGTGEALEDLAVFDAARYARRLVDAS